MHQIRQKNQNPAKEMQPDRRSRRRAVRVRRARLAISSIAPVDRRSRRAISSIVDRAGAIVALSSLSLSDLGFLFSLSLSLFPEVIWSENEGSNWFPGQRWKNWSTGSHFPENNIFRDSQTCGKGWKWFPEIIFTQNKRTLNHKTRKT